MDIKKLAIRLDEISSEMENFTSDASLLTMLKDFRGIQGRLDEIIGELQDKVANELEEGED